MHHRFVLSWIAALSLFLLLDAAAHAQAPAVEAQPTEEWYGWQTLIADGVSMTAVLISANHVADDGGDTAFGLSITSLILALPIIHGVHGNWGAFRLSLDREPVAVTA